MTCCAGYREGKGLNGFFVALILITYLYTAGGIFYYQSWDGLDLVTITQITFVIIYQGDMRSTKKNLIINGN